MFNFAIKNMAVKRAQIILIILSIVISAGVAVLAYNTAEQVSDGISSTAGYYSAIIGPSGSSTQLAMNTMYFTDEVLGTIPYSIVNELKQDMRVKTVIPYAMADSFNGFRLVGTISEFLSSKEISDGRMFDDSNEFEIVLGSNVAETCGISIGDSIYTSHSVGEEHHTPYTVVGILKETHTVYDNVCFTELSTIWTVHEEEEAEEEGEDEHEEMNGMVCAILVKTSNPSYAMTLVDDYNGKVYTAADHETGSISSYSLQAIEPMSAVRSVLEDADTTKYIVYILCGIILVMNIIIISIITLLNMYHSSKEIKLMRLIGISMKNINCLYLIQNSIIGLTAIILAFGLSRLCLLFMGDYVASMGVVLNPCSIYPLEWIILAAVFIISILPTFIWINSLAKKDSLGE